MAPSPLTHFSASYRWLAGPIWCDSVGVRYRTRGFVELNSTVAVVFVSSSIQGWNWQL